MDILQGLNDKQKEAVIAIDGNIRVTAGAGSGKTPVYDFYKQSCTGNEEPY